MWSTCISPIYIIINIDLAFALLQNGLHWKSSICIKSTAITAQPVNKPEPPSPAQSDLLRPKLPRQSFLTYGFRLCCPAHYNWYMYFSVPQILPSGYAGKSQLWEIYYKPKALSLLSPSSPFPNSPSWDLKERQQV